MENICQSCAMPLTEENLYGTNADGSHNKDYCIYCYAEGQFTSDQTMEEMIDTCLPFMIEEGMKESDARSILEATLPTLKRWQ